MIFWCRVSRNIGGQASVLLCSGLLAGWQIAITNVKTLIMLSLSLKDLDSRQIFP